MRKNRFLLLLFVLFCSCNNTLDKPCSKEDVKNKVLILFKNEYDSSLTLSAVCFSNMVKMTVLKDSISDIFSHPENDNTCNCEATIYYYVRLKDVWTEQQKKQNWYKYKNDDSWHDDPTVTIYDSADVRRQRESHSGDPKHWPQLSDEETYHHVNYNHEYRNRVPDGWSDDVRLEKKTVKYEVKISDDGKTYVTLNK